MLVDHVDGPAGGASVSYARLDELRSEEDCLAGYVAAIRATVRVWLVACNVVARLYLTDTRCPHGCPPRVSCYPRAACEPVLVVFKSARSGSRRACNLGCAWAAPAVRAQVSLPLLEVAGRSGQVSAAT